MTLSKDHRIADRTGPVSGIPRIAVFGTGALGSLLAARIGAAQAGDVTVLGTWAAALEAIARRGITIDGENVDEGRAGSHTGSRLVARVRACHRDTLANHPAERAAAESEAVGPFDLVLVVVKSWQTPAIAPFVARAVSQNGLVISLQNGLGNREVLARHVAPAQLAAGVTAVGARLLAPGRVRPGGDGGTVLAPPDGAAANHNGDDTHLLRAARVFRDAGLTVHTTDDLAPAVWSKLAVNCAINPLTALAHVPNGVLVETAGRRRLMTAIAREVASVASAQSIVFDHDPAKRALDVAAATATNHNSMLQDVLTGRRTEIDALSGAVVARAEAVGVDVPLNRALAERVSQLDDDRDHPARMAGRSDGAEPHPDLDTLRDLEAVAELASSGVPQAVA